MASAVATDKIATQFLLALYDHDPDSTDAKVTSADGGTTEKWLDMRDYRGFAVMVAPGAMTGAGITQVEIVASETADETDSSVTVIKDSSTVAADALGDYVFLECTAEEIAHAASTYALRYVAARITLDNAADEATVIYFGIPLKPHDGLTATTIA